MANALRLMKEGGAELLRIVDPALMLEHAEKWGRLYESIFLSQRR